MSEEVTNSTLETGKDRVEYEVTKLDECSHSNCDSRRNYGVKVTRIKERNLFDIIPIGQEKQEKVFCPEHRSSVPESDKALKREHRSARYEWKQERKKRMKRDYSRIIESGLLPTFRYSYGTINMDNDRFQAEGFDESEEALDFILNFRVNKPILLHGKPNWYAVVRPNKDEYTVYDVYKDDKRINYENFKREFSDVQFAQREFYNIKTNSLTGMDTDTPMNELEEHIDKVIEWNEYTEPQGKLSPIRCHICGYRLGGVEKFSRVMQNCRQTILVSHTRCENIIGELNPNLIDKSAYDIVGYSSEQN